MVRFDHFKCDTDMTRLEYNRKIVERLKEEIEKYPKWRFGQLIQNLGVVDSGDCFYIESRDSYERLIRMAEYFNKGE